MKSYRKIKDRNSFRGMSVNYALKGELHEISSLNELDLEGLVRQMESEKKIESKAS